MRISDWSSDVCSSDLFDLGPVVISLRHVESLSCAPPATYATTSRSVPEIAGKASLGGPIPRSEPDEETDYFGGGIVRPGFRHVRFRHPAGLGWRPPGFQNLPMTRDLPGWPE